MEPIDQPTDEPVDEPDEPEVEGIARTAEEAPRTSKGDVDLVFCEVRAVRQQLEELQTQLRELESASAKGMSLDLPKDLAPQLDAVAVSPVSTLAAQIPSWPAPWPCGADRRGKLQRAAQVLLKRLAPQGYDLRR